jgi:hypothetical protein
VASRRLEDSAGGRYERLEELAEVAAVKKPRPSLTAGTISGN